MTKQLRDRIADIIAKGRKDECISLDIAERIIIHLQGESSPPTFRDGSTMACSICKKEICTCPGIDRGSFAKYVEEEV